MTKKNTTHIRMSIKIKKQVDLIPGKSYDEKINKLCKTSIIYNAIKTDQWLGDEFKLFKKKRK